MQILFMTNLPAAAEISPSFVPMPKEPSQTIQIDNKCLLRYILISTAYTENISAVSSTVNCGTFYASHSSLTVLRAADGSKLGHLLPSTALSTPNYWHQQLWVPSNNCRKRNTAVGCTVTVIICNVSKALINVLTRISNSRFIHS